MSNEKKLEQLVILGLDAAKKSIASHKHVIPFAVRVFCNSEEVTLTSYHDDRPDDNWDDLLNYTVEKLKPIVASGDIYATGIFTELQNGDDFAIGLQIETIGSARLFIYPYSVDDAGEVKLADGEPIESDNLIAGKVFFQSE